MRRAVVILSCLLVGCSGTGFDKREKAKGDQRGKTMQEKKTFADISAQFNALAQQWGEHCKNVALSSNINDYLNAPSYRGLVDLGPSAIPYIMDRYRTGMDTLPWEFVLDEITGLHMIQDRNHFSPPKIKKWWIEWWDKQRGTSKGTIRP